MADTPLRLEALVVDKFSRPLGDLKRQLSGIKSPNLTPARREFEKFHDEVRRASVAVKDGYGQAMSGLGLSSAVGLISIAAITGAVRNFAKSTIELRSVSKETGIAMRNFQLLQGVAEQFGSSKEAVTGGLQEFAKNIFDIRRGVGEARGQIALLDRSGGLLKALSGKDSNKALDASLKYLERLNQVDPERAGRLSELLFGTRDFARMTQIPGLLKERLEALAKIKKAPTEKEIADAQQFTNLLADMDAAAQKLGTTIGKELLGPLTKFLESVDTGVGKLFEFNKNLKELGDWGKAADKTFLGTPEDRKMLPVVPRDGKAGESAASVFDRMRRLNSDESRSRDALRDGVKEGSREGVEAALEKLGFSGGGGGARLLNASLDPAAQALWDKGVGRGGPSSRELQAQDVWRKALRKCGKEHALPGAAPEPRSGAAVDPGDMGVDHSGVRNLRRKFAGLSGEQRREMAGAIRKVAGDIGISPAHLASIMSFETGGTLDPWKAGPTTKWGQHRGLIQWGEPQAKKYGVSRDSSITEQIEAVGRYLRDRGVKPGMGLENIYGAVIAGSATRGLDRTDANGTSARSGAMRMWNSQHRFALDNLEKGAPARGTAFRAAREAEASINLPPIKGSALLDVRIRGGNADVNASTEGGLFQDVRVNRGRTLRAAPE